MYSLNVYEKLEFGDEEDINLDVRTQNGWTEM